MSLHYLTKVKLPNTNMVSIIKTKFGQALEALCDESFSEINIETQYE